MNKKSVLGTTLIVLCVATVAQAALTKVSLLNIGGLAPANVNGWTAGRLPSYPAAATRSSRTR